MATARTQDGFTPRKGARSLLGATILLAALTALLIDTSSSRAAFPGLNGTIACGGVRAPGTDIEIFQVNPDGTGEVVLTSNDVRDGSPAYSPDGTKIAFEGQFDNIAGEPANTEIYVANNDGDLGGPDLRRLTFNKGTLPNGTISGLAATDFSPSWSPDGTQIVFHSGRVTTFTDGGTSPTNDFEIYKMSATEGEAVTPATRLTVNRGQDAIPSWSPDGTKIAFQGFPAGNPSTLSNNLEVFTMNPDGSGIVNVSNNPGTPNDPVTTTINENANGLDRDIIWSPDGKQIAFSSTRTSTVVGYQNFEVWRANRDGSNPVRLTSNADAPVPEPFTDFDVPLAWSPDGTRLLFASSRASTPAADIFDIYTMNPVTGGSVSAPIARVSQFQRCDWRALAVPVTPPPPVAPPPPAGAAYPTPTVVKETAKLAVARARIDRGDRVLDVLASITRKASGRVRMELQAAGRRYRFTAAIDSRRGLIRVRKRIPAAQAALGTGILTITYAGDTDTRPQTVRLRAAARAAFLRAARPTISSNGRLRTAGTISRRARGVVRVQLEYDVDGKTTTLRLRATIANGRWSLNERLTQAQRDAIARRTGTVHSYILFTGYAPARMRGEMRSYQVLGSR